MKIYQADTFAEVYKEVLTDLYHTPEFVTKPRDQKVNEMLDVSLVINDPIYGMYDNSRRSTQYIYIAAELLWYFSGENKIDFIENYAKFWKQIANRDGTANSAYGHLIFNKKNEHGMSQWEWAYSSLIKDTDTRQAIMHFNIPEHQFIENKDFVCTLYGIFHIRDNKLSFSVHMRSNDAILGLPTDVAFFTLLQQQMLNLLRKSPYTDKFKNLKLGKYTHFDNSLHIYERNMELVKEMLENKFIKTRLPPIGLDFVDSVGHQTKNMAIIYDVVNNYLKETTTRQSFINFSFKDELFDWILANVQKNKIN